MKDSTDLIESLEALADTLVGDEWQHPITAVADVRWAIEKIRQLQKENKTLREMVNR